MYCFLFTVLPGLVYQFRPFLPGAGQSTGGDLSLEIFSQKKKNIQVMGYLYRRIRPAPRWGKLPCTLDLARLPGRQSKERYRGYTQNTLSKKDIIVSQTLKQ